MDKLTVVDARETNFYNSNSIPVQKRAIEECPSRPSLGHRLDKFRQKIGNCTPKLSQLTLYVTQSIKSHQFTYSKINNKASMGQDLEQVPLFFAMSIYNGIGLFDAVDWREKSWPNAFERPGVGSGTHQFISRHAKLLQMIKFSLSGQQADREERKKTRLTGLLIAVSYNAK